MNDHIKRAETVPGTNSGSFAPHGRSAPDQELAAPRDYRSEPSAHLDAEIDKLINQLRDLKIERRERQLIDIPRAVPLDIGKVVFRMHHDNDGEPSYMMLDHVETDDDYEDEFEDKELQAFLYAAAWDFAHPGDSDSADIYLDTDDQSHEDGQTFYWLDLHEDGCVERVQQYAQGRGHGSISPKTEEKIAAYTERAIRLRAQTAGIKTVHMDDDRDTKKVTSFTAADGTTVAFDEQNPDHQFIAEMRAHSQFTLDHWSSPAGGFRIEV